METKEEPQPPKQPPRIHRPDESVTFSMPFKGEIFEALDNFGATNAPGPDASSLSVRFEHSSVICQSYDPFLHHFLSDSRRCTAQFNVGSTISIESSSKKGQHWDDAVWKCMKVERFSFFFFFFFLIIISYESSLGSTVTFLRDKKI
jgi:hypothetical protein